MKRRCPSLVLRALRYWRRRFWPSNLQVVYHPRYEAAFPEAPVDPLRADRILAFLASEGLVLRRSVFRPEPVWLKALAMVHTPEYLDAVHEVKTMTSIMGTEVSADQVQRLIDFQRLQVGGSLMAVRRARRKGLAINLGGGYHHASAAGGAGFCVFNDVAVAIADERRRGFAGRVLVVDLDLHDGDGTRELFQDDATVHTFSVHARHWGPTEAVESTAIELGKEVEDAQYLGVLRELLPPLFARFQPQMVIYLAGCDPAHDDTLGDWKITPEAMLERDRLVVALCRKAEPAIPLAILLAGGYGAECWRYSARFLADLESPGSGLEPPSTVEITLKRYRYISSLFEAGELSGGGADDDFGLTEEDLFLPGWSGHRETRFLGFYTRHGLELVLERSGFLDRLRDMGFAHPTLELQLDDTGNTLRIFGGPELEELLCELRLQRDRRLVPGFELLSIEWLLMQNPRAAFSGHRPRLPGQKHPGLGLLDDVVALLIVACDRLHLDGIAFTPSQFHVAAYGRSHMKFLDPTVQDTFHALLDFVKGVDLATASQAVAHGRVLDADTREPFHWTAEPMVLAVSHRMQGHLAESLQHYRPPEHPRRFAWARETGFD